MSQASKKLDKTVAVLAPSFSDGGAERVMSYLVNHSKNFQPYSLSNRIDYLTEPHTCVLADADGSGRCVRRLKRALFVFKTVMTNKTIMTCSYELFILAALSQIAHPNRTIIFRPSIDLNYILSEISDRFPRMAPYIALLLKILIRRSKIIYQSNAIEKSFLSFAPKSSIKLPNPVSYDQSAIKPFRRSMKSPRHIVYAGRLTHEKGFDRFLERHKAEHVNPNFQWLCYGVGAMTDRAKYQALQLPNLHVHGWKSRQEFEATNSVLVVPSRIEGAPNIVLEAFLAGWPVIASPEVFDIFKEDDVIRKSLYVFDFDNQTDLCNIAEKAIKGQSFEDHMLQIAELLEVRSIRNYSQSIHEFTQIS